jgi:hypothetical protein
MTQTRGKPGAAERALNTKIAIEAVRSAIALCSREARNPNQVRDV